MRTFVVSVRNVIEYDVTVDAEGFDAAAAAAINRAKTHVPRMLRAAIGTTNHNDSEQKVLFISEHD